jgi:hypothetical protein
MNELLAEVIVPTVDGSDGSGTRRSRRRSLPVAASSPSTYGAAQDFFLGRT